MSDKCGVQRTGSLISADGALTIRRADELKQLLSDAIDANMAVAFDCAQVSEADLCGIQIVLSARRTALTQGKEFTLAGAATGPLLDALTRGGFLQDATGGASVDRGFWLKDQ